MHKLGDTVTTEEEEEKFRRINEKIRSILTARRNLYNAGVELLECDRVYAEGIKAELCFHCLDTIFCRFNGCMLGI